MKYQLNHKLVTDYDNKSGADIARLLKKKTHSIITKLQHSIWIEIACCVLVLLPMGYVGINSQHWSLRLYFGSFALLTLVFMVFLAFLLRKISRLSQSATPVKSNLQTIVNVFEEFIKRYFQFCMALIPVCFTFSLLLSSKDPIRVPQIDRIAAHLFSASWQVYFFLVVYMLALASAVYYFTRWYLRKLYGKYIDQLKDCIEELSGY